MPPPEFAIDMPVEATTAITDHHQRRTAARTAADGAGARDEDAAALTGKGLSQPEYPPAARRLGQEGTVTLLIYVWPTDASAT